MSKKLREFKDWDIYFKVNSSKANWIKVRQDMNTDLEYSSLMMWLAEHLDYDTIWIKVENKTKNKTLEELKKEFIIENKGKDGEK